MKINLVGKSVFLALLCAAAVVAPSAPVLAESSPVVETHETTSVVDAMGDAADKVKDVSEALAEALASKSTDPKTLDSLMSGLDKMGVKGGWAQKIGKLSKVKGVASAFGTAISLLKAGVTGKTLVDAYKAGDRELFRNTVADAITSLSAGTISTIVTTLWAKAGGTVVAGLALTGPGAIIAGGVVLVSGWYLSNKVDEWITNAMNNGEMHDLLLKLGDSIWDAMSQDGKDGNGGDPFDERPENSGGGNSRNADRYQGLKTLKLID